LFSYGKVPYQGMSNVSVIQQVAEGYRLLCPENCPTEVYNIMVACWGADAEKRPSFENLAETIATLVSQFTQEESIMADVSTYNSSSLEISYN
jgi:hypothetical protein